jgi:hypothetical protein
MAGFKNIIWISFLAYMVSSCAVSTKTELMIPASDFREPTIVVGEGLSRIPLINTFRQAGWEVQFSGVLAGGNETEKLMQYREQKMIQEKNAKEPAANYMAFVMAVPSGVCTDFHLGTELLFLDTAVGINPHYLRYDVSIYDVRTNRSVFSVRTGGCENKVMSKVRKELSRLVSIHPGQARTFDY